MRKEGCLYIDGVIDNGAHGIYHVSLENGLPAVVTARKMEALRLSLLQGDNVVVEIPALSMSPSEKLKGRIVWRHKTRF